MKLLAALLAVFAFVYLALRLRPARPAAPVALWRVDRGLGISVGRRWMAVRINIQVGGVL